MLPVVRLELRSLRRPHLDESAFGPGLGLAFTTASIAALAGVAEHESGLASGLSTAFQIGAALGVAIVSTVALRRIQRLAQKCWQSGRVGRDGRGARAPGGRALGVCAGTAGE